MNIYLQYILAFVATASLSAVLTLIIKAVAQRRGILDQPTISRKIHSSPVPLLGGLAVIGAFSVITLVVTYSSDIVIGQHIAFKNILAVIIAGLILGVSGWLDDRYQLRPSRQLIGPFLAILTVIVGGIGITQVSNPFGGLLHLDAYQWVLLWWHGVPYRLTLPADAFTVIWLLGMMYTVKLLDGLDGLVAGMGTIGALVIFLLSSATRWWQPETAMLSIILAGACFGFLFFNWYPAKIFLGESGPLFIGFILGVLAIISGAKIATALLIMGVPILDVVWVVIRRAVWERANPFTTADRKHLHFRLLDVGFSHRQAVAVLYAFSLIFGSLALFLQSLGKVFALAALLVVMLCFGAFLVILTQSKDKQL
ncbi:undecaprenyl/decaprenyl-phosphate alpha-N-acetylglucosaminyl 1-phosphate transferase [Candidatus Falkowbacteria bacterium]|nr:undecaprenyl/decaprenyl-phosphate alpha-N-acetylglucosaminyl 1-phosphate transferase [Candidatus Falkowbacteria bacterium]